MTSVTNTTGTAPVTPTTSVSNPNATLDKDGFLKLLVAQMQNQDPTSPTDTNQSIQQMSSFTMVEQLTNMAQQNTQIAQQLSTTNAIGLIGRTVSYTDASGALQSGKVEGVSTTTDGGATLTVAGQTGVDPSSISSVS
jgi:flagellar basal-body rod modification protein FlgD